MSRVIEFTGEEVDILTGQLSYRCDELDKYIKEKAAREQDFDDTYELKKKIMAIMEKLYRSY